MVLDSNDKLHELLRISDGLNHIKDIDSLLDTILYETRRLTNADAGSIFLLENSKLEFSYVQNDTFKRRDPHNSIIMEKAYVNEQSTCNKTKFSF